MDSLASLGFKIDSTPIEETVAALNELPSAGARAETANDNLQRSNETLSQSNRKLTGSLRELTDIQRQIGSATGIGSGLTGRAADIAAYGQSLDALRAKYSPLFAAQQQYRTELAEVRKALAVGAINQNEYAEAITNTKLQFINQIDAIRPGVNALADTSKASGAAAKGFHQASFEARNLGFQLVDVTQGVLMGQSAFQIFAQQAGQIAQIIATSPRGLGGLMKELGASVAGVLTPFNLLAAGLATVAIGSYAVFRSIAEGEKDFANLAERIGTTTDALHRFESAGAGKGFSGDTFLKGMEQFGALSLEAQHNTGELAKLFRVNGVAVGDMNENLLRTADLIKNAKNEQERYRLVAQLGLEPSRELVKYLSQGSDEIKRAADEANTLGETAEKQIVDKARKADEEWNKFWHNFAIRGKAAIVEAQQGIQGLDAWLSQKLNAAGNALGNKIGTPSPMEQALNNLRAGVGTRLDTSTGREFSSLAGSGAGGKKDTRSATDIENDLRREQQQIAVLGQMATVTQQVRAAEISLQLASASGVNITNAQRKAILDLARERALGIDQMKAEADANNIEAATLGMTAGQAAAYTAEMNRLNEATRNHQILSKEDKDAIHNQAQELGKSADAAARARIQFEVKRGRDTAFLSQEDVDIANRLKDVYATIPEALNSSEAAAMRLNNALGDISKAMSSGLTTAIEDMVNGTKSAGEAFKDFGMVVVKALEEAIIKLTIVGPLMRSLQGAFGGGGGGILSLLGLANGGVMQAGHLQAFALGGVVTRPTLFPMANGTGLMGEAGPEAIIPLRRTATGRLGVEMAGGSGGIGQVTYAPVINAPGASKEDVQAALTQASREFEQRIVPKMVDAKRRNQLRGVFS